MSAYSRNRASKPTGLIKFGYFRSGVFEDSVNSEFAASIGEYGFAFATVGAADTTLRNVNLLIALLVAVVIRSIMQQRANS